MPTMILLWTLLPALALADRPQTIDDLVSAGEVDKAQKKCESWDASLLTADPALRDMCAKAFWRTTEAEGTVDAWKRYREIWVGTRGEQPARRKEAWAALEALRAPGEADYLQHARAYPDTPAAKKSRFLAGEAAANAATDAEGAARVATEYPGHPGLDALAERFLQEFVQVEVDGVAITAALRPPMAVPSGKSLEVGWVARHGDGRVVPWVQEARDHLVAAGLDVATIEALRGAGDPARPFPLCHDPTAPQGWQAGVSVTLGDATAFVPTSFDPGCGLDAWPAVITVVAGRITDLSLRPGHLLSTPTRREAVPAHPGGARPWLHADPANPVTIAQGKVVAQAVGDLFLVHPMTGRLPWFTADKPPSGIVAVPMGRPGAPPPPGWTLQPQGAAGTRILGPALSSLPAGAREWTVPPGDLRVLSPLVQWATGLNHTNPKLTLASAPPLPPSTDQAFWIRQRGTIAPRPPTGAREVRLVPMAADALRDSTRLLTAHGAGLTPVRGWQVPLDADGPLEHVVEVRAGATPLLLVLDPYASGASRVWVFDPGHGFAVQDGQPLAFDRDGQVYFALVGRDATGSWVRAVHWDASGLASEFSSDAGEG